MNTNSIFDALNEMKKKKEEIVVSLALLGMLAVFTSSLMYYAERAAQPEAFGSIPKAVWWSVVTITTVGYGNATPVTIPGQVLGGLVALLGTGMGAVPAGFLASGFSDALESKSKKGAAREKSVEPPSTTEIASYCPHCGSSLEHLANGQLSNGKDVNGQKKAERVEGAREPR